MPHAPLEAARQVLVNGLAPEPEDVWVAFEGHIERVAEGIAHLSLLDAEGARSFASYDAGSLAASGITEGSRFTCRVALTGSKAELTFRPERRERMTDDDLAQLWQRIDTVLNDNLSFGHPVRDNTQA